jgi:hypothetical protein
LFDCQVRVVGADSAVVDPLFLPVTTCEIREMMEEVDDCVRLALIFGAVGRDLWLSGWWWRFELGGVEVNVSR